MEHRDLEIFLTLAEELHFSRTATRLHISQARVSQSIKHLERHVGAPLFTRTSRRVTLTPLGARLRADLAPAYQGVLDAISRATRAARAHLRIGFEAPALADLLPHLHAYRKSHPTTEIHIREADFRTPLALLRSNEVDVLITTRPPTPDLILGPAVLTEPLVLATATTHRLAEAPTITLADLAGEEIFTASYTPPLPTSPRGFATFQELLTAIAADEGVCPLAAHAATYFTRPGITFTPISDAPPLRWSMLWRKSDEPPTVRDFAATAR
ncbi:LysR substrate-binding domain-containing protein [Actinosynnema sp. NPDC020468]|uniref:LysR family transcriptional regulator n=1 Tax=Actinosynnema sp. NPDC020468 TaxID=3154488 RepID=UPI0033F2298D